MRVHDYKVYSGQHEGHTKECIVAEKCARSPLSCAGTLPCPPRSWDLSRPFASRLVESSPIVLLAVVAQVPSTVRAVRETESRQQTINAINGSCPTPNRRVEQ